MRDVTLALVEHFSASRFWQQVRASSATHIHFLGGILQILLKQPRPRSTTSMAPASPGAAAARVKSGARSRNASVCKSANATA